MKNKRDINKEFKKYEKSLKKADRDTFYFFYDVSDGSMQVCFVYSIKFNKKVSVNYFRKIMDIARSKNNSFASLYDKKFTKKYGIVSCIELKQDYQAFKEEVVDYDFDPDFEIEFDPDLEASSEVTGRGIADDKESHIDGMLTQEEINRLLTGLDVDKSTDFTPLEEDCIDVDDYNLCSIFKTSLDLPKDGDSELAIYKTLVCNTPRHRVLNGVVIFDEPFETRLVNFKSVLSNRDCIIYWDDDDCNSNKRIFAFASKEEYNDNLHRFFELLDSFRFKYISHYDFTPEKDMFPSIKEFPDFHVSHGIGIFDIPFYTNLKYFVSGNTYGDCIIIGKESNNKATIYAFSISPSCNDNLEKLYERLPKDKFTYIKDTSNDSTPFNLIPSIFLPDEFYED